jgi:hypothetical protein
MKILQTPVTNEIPAFFLEEYSLQMVNEYL